MSNEIPNEFVEQTRERPIKEMESAIPSFGEGWRQNTENSSTICWIIAKFLH